MSNRVHLDMRFLMVTRYQDLLAYRFGRELVRDIHELSESWPVEERYMLTSQIRRSSRSICSNLAEAWGKREYRKSFIAKVVDAESEACETMNWLQMAIDLAVANANDVQPLLDRCGDIIRLLRAMKRNASSWCFGPAR